MRGWPLALLATVSVVVVVGVLAVVAVTGGGGTSIFDLEVGDCFDLPIDGAADDAAEVAPVDVVEVGDCAEPHEVEVVMVGELNPDGDRAYPPDNELFAEIDARCGDVRFDASGRADANRFDILPIAPNEASWGPFDGAFSCVAIPIGGALTTGSVGPLPPSD